MRTSFLMTLISLAAACGAEQPIPPAPTKVEPVQQISEPQVEPVAVAPDTDSLGDVEWSPNSTDALGEVSETAIDLEMGDGYEPVRVNGEAPRVYESMKCKTAKDCKGMRRPKMPGEKRCIKNTCVFVGKPLHVEDVIEVF